MYAYGLSNNLMVYRVRGMQLTISVILLTGAINAIGIVGYWL